MFDSMIGALARTRTTRLRDRRAALAKALTALASRLAPPPTEARRPDLATRAMR